MKLGRGERVTVTLKKEEKDKIELAANLLGRTVSAYVRDVLLNNAENVIKKVNKSK